MRSDLRWFFPTASAIALLVGCAHITEAKIMIATGGKSDYQIVVSAKASPSEKHAAEELQTFLEQICGPKLPIVTDNAEMTSHEIILGDNTHLQKLDVEVLWEKLGDEGFTIQTVGEHLVIAGGRLRGTLYGVYTFLEEHLGCRWWTAEFSYIPQIERLTIGEIDDTQVPVFEVRDTDYQPAIDGDWAARNKLNGYCPRLRERHGGKPVMPVGHHSFYKIIPRSELASHPQYFSLISGKRTAEGAQLCLTNPELPHIFAERIKQALRQPPGAPYYTDVVVGVSHNDCGGWCECPACQALNEKEGEVSGSLIYFVNKVAEEIEEEFPNVGVETLAYGDTLKPPRNIRPRHNVQVCICPFHQCYTHPMCTCEWRGDYVGADRHFPEWLKGWRRLTDRLRVWYYLSSGDALMPFPNNLHVMWQNFRDFADYDVRDIHAQAVANVPYANGVAQLRAYLLAKALWNPYRDMEKVMAEFLEAYYGRASKPIGQYLHLLNRRAHENNLHMGTFGASPVDPFFAGDILDRAKELFDEAERLADSKEILRRVQTARLPVEYVELFRAGRLSLHNGFLASEGLGERRELLEQCRATARELGIGQFESFYQRWHKIGAGSKVVTLENSDIRVDLVPALGGRIYRLVDKQTSQDLLRVPSFDNVKEFHKDKNLYPYVGGYQEYITGDQQRGGWQEEYQSEIKSTAVGQRVVLTTDLPNGLVVRRVIGVPRQSGARIRVKTTVTNNQPKALEVELTGQTEFKLGRTEDCELIIPGSSAKAQQYRFMRERHDREIILQDEPVGAGGLPTWMRVVGPKPPEGWLLLMNRHTGVAIRQNFDREDTRRCRLSWDFGYKRLNSELSSLKGTLEPGKSLTYSHSYEIVRDLSSELAKLKIEP